MKRQHFYQIILSLAAFVFTFTSCVKGEFDEPPINIPKFEGTANKTIAELKAGYLGVLDSIEEDIIISGKVIGNDESGNIYKQLVIQDATGGIVLGLDRTNMYNEFKIGQRVFVKCKGMYIGDYNGLIQLGAKYNGAIGRMADAQINSHIFRDSLPGPAPAPTVVTLSANNKDKISMLVKFDNVHFTEVGQPWSSLDATTNRTLLDAAGKSIIVRTSNYANFASYKIPSGTGNVTGILSIFGTTYQLTIRDTNDAKGFVPPPPVYFEESFAASLGGFAGQSVSGSQTWGFDATYKFAKISGYQSGASHANEDWLISPVINLSTAPAAVVNFDHTINKGALANLKTNHTLWISKNYSSGAPSTATWEQITIPTYPTGADWTFVGSGSCVIPAAYLGQANVRLAFKYLCSDTESATWEIKNLKVTRN